MVLRTVELLNSWLLGVRCGAGGSDGGGSGSGGGGGCVVVVAAGGGGGGGGSGGARQQLFMLWSLFGCMLCLRLRCCGCGCIGQVITTCF